MSFFVWLCYDLVTTFQALDPILCEIAIKALQIREDLHPTCSNLGLQLCSHSSADLSGSSVQLDYPLTFLSEAISLCIVEQSCRPSLAQKRGWRSVSAKGKIGSDLA